MPSLVGELNQRGSNEHNNVSLVLRGADVSGQFQSYLKHERLVYASIHIAYS